MKKRSFIIVLVLMLAIASLQAQNYNMGSSSSVTTCTGNFYDSGGPSGNYTKDEDYTMTFYPGSAGSIVKFTFTLFVIEYQSNCNKDYLRIYDGESSSDPLIGEYCGTDSPGTILATGPTGAITFVFHSDNKNSVYSGWVASISCATGGQGFSGVWTGNTSNDWNDSGNWDDGNVPGVSTDVVIPTSPEGGYFPESNSGNTAVCNNLTIETGAHLFVPADNNLTVSATLSNLAGEAGLVIKSSASGTGSLIHNTTNVSATIEQYLTNMQWHYIGSPVENETANIFVLPSGHSDIYLQIHDELTNIWGDYITDPTTQLELGRGYKIWVGNPSGGIQQDEIVKFSGELNNGDYTTGSNGYFDLSYTSGSGFNLISNPYPSALTGNIGSWDKKWVSNAIWVWDSGLGNYLFWNGSNGSNSNGYGTLANGIIPPLQGFFVQTTKSNVNTGLTIPQSSRLHSSQTFYKSTDSFSKILQLDVVGNESRDGMFIVFNEDATNGFDEALDVNKFFGMAEAPQLYSKVGSEYLSVNNLPLVQNECVVNISFSCNTSGIYELEASFLESFNDFTEVYLEDIVENTLHNLNEISSYSFFHDEGNIADRFKIHFGLLNGVNSEHLNDIRVYSFNNYIYINNSKQEELDVSVYNMLGQEVRVSNSSALPMTLTKIALHGLSGYYIVKVISSEGTTTKKISIH